MITVRFPNGQAVQYNTGWYVQPGPDGIWIYESKEKKRLHAFVPASSGAVIEWVPPCRVYDGLHQDHDKAVLAELELLRKELRKLRLKK